MARAKAKPKRPASSRQLLPLRLEWRDPAELAANPRNWRSHPDAQTQALDGALAEVGWAGALLYNQRTGRLIDGHARKAVDPKHLVGGKVPVLVGDWSEEQEAKILATLDPLAGMAQADAAKLDALLRDVSTDNEALTALLDGLAHENGLAPGVEPGGGGDEFDATPEAGPTRTKPGELWVIGRTHRLLVGDCTDAANVGRLMGGAKVGLCFTSPPYAQQRDYGAKITDWDALMQGAFAPLAGHLTPDGQILVNLGLVHRDGEWVPYWDGWIGWMREQGWRRFGWYVWDQGPGMPGDWQGRFAPSFEFVFHFNAQSVKPNKTVESKNGGKMPHGGAMRGADGAVGEWSSPSKPHASHRIPDNVIRVMRHKARGVECEHPAVFPVALPSAFIETWPTDVYDPFLGSGTTLIAAHRLGRVCYGCEIECRYADVVLRRAEAEGLSCERTDS